MHLSKAIENHQGLFDFLAYILNPDSLNPSQLSNEIDREFARISVSLLKQMGEKYVALADGLVEYLDEGKYYEEDEVQVNELKVLLVGDGGVGKTSLIKRMLDNDFDHNEYMTHGINNHDRDIKINNTTIKAHFWDFGGQEIMHTIHPLFFSRRSLYILVLDGRKEENAEYWLNYIKVFGGNSPVIVVLNKIDDYVSYEVNRKFLKEKYPNILGFHKVSCATSQGISELYEAIKEATVQVESITTKWAKSWFDVKNNIENLKENFINQKQYKTICNQNDITNEGAQNVLADYLNDLGILIHFDDLELHDIYITQPKWIINAIYSIITSMKLEVFDKSLLLEIYNLNEYPPYTHQYIIDLMKKFELCYSLNESEYLIPSLLQIQEPTFDFDYENALKFELHYGFLPKSILPVFIVKNNRDIKNKLRWRLGVVLEDKITQSIAVVKVDEREKQIYIYVDGEEKRKFLAVIRERFNDINSKFKEIEATEWIPLPDHPNEKVKYLELIGYEKAGRDEYFHGRLRKTFSISKLLNGVERRRFSTFRKAFLIRGGDRVNPNDTPLQYLDNSIEKLKNTLVEYGDWDVETFVLNGTDDLLKRLRNINDKEDTEILIFYTGHGVPQSQNRYALIGDNANEVLFDNIINPIQKFASTRFSLIIDASYSDNAIDFIPQVDNIEIVTSVSRGLAFEHELFETSNFTHYFTKSITDTTLEKDSPISLEYICNYINQNDEIRQKPLRIPPIYNRFTKHITIAQSQGNKNKDKPIAKAPIEFPYGQVPMESIFYISREDHKAYEMLRSNYCSILIKAPRQYGKTSLLSRLIKTAREDKYQVVFLHFQEFDKEMLINLDELLNFICNIVSLECDIEPNVNEKILARLTPKMKASKILDSILSQMNTPIVLAFDESDRLFEYQNVSDEFFGLIRAWHEKSKDNFKWQKLKIILSHSTEPFLGITNINQSPFHNVGLGMELKAFNYEETSYLANTAYQLNLNDKEITKLLEYIGGHPYLTRKVLYEMSTESINLINALNIKRFEEHLRRYKLVFQSNPLLIETIKEVINGDCPNMEHCYTLEATGFIKNAMNKIQFSSKLYEEFFKTNF